jgi:hypothetical protein
MSTVITPEQAKAELDLLEAELRRRRWQEDPLAWSTEKLGDTLWSVQQHILRSVRDNRRTAVASCHEVGKSYISALVCGWWIDSAPLGEAFVVTSAPSGHQVKTILWREIGRVHTRGQLAGRVNQTEWWVRMPGDKEEIVAFGRKPDDYDPTAFQGIHARRVLYVFDEACGIPASLWEAADSLIANDESKALAIGNPDDPQSEFYEVCKPGSGWNVIWISAFDSPNFTGENLPSHILKKLVGKTYVEERRNKWARQWVWVDYRGSTVYPPQAGKAAPVDGVRVVPPDGVNPEDTSPLWQSKVLGRFPKLTDDMGLIPLHWIQAAQLRSLPPDGENVIGVDVGGGGDSSCGCNKRGYRFRILWEDKIPDTMVTCGNVIHHLAVTGATVANVDMIGIGRGVVDRGKEQKKPIEGITVSNAAEEDEFYYNLRAELWWKVRELFEAGNIDLDPDDEDLAAELASVRYKRNSRGQIQIETKDEAKRRGVPSPNRAEALMLTLAKPPKKLQSATWGRR